MFFVLLTVFFLGILVVGIVLARRNLASGRGDRRGAWRIACAVAITEVIAGLLLMTHTITFEELGTLLARAGSALFKGAVVWLLYIAIEPEIRNRWPHRIVAWARLLDGRFRDPLVGRHILIGVLCGLAIPILAQGAQAAEIHLRGAMNPETIAILNYAVIGLRGVMGAIVAAANFGIMLPLGFAVLWLGMFLVLRRETFAAVGLGAVLFLGLFIQRPYPLMVVGIGLTVGMVLFVMLRYGLLALVVSQWALHVSIFYPLTRDSKDWFFSGSTLAAFVVLILACFGAWVASYAGVKSQIETTLKAQT